MYRDSNDKRFHAMWSSPSDAKSVCRSLVPASAVSTALLYGIHWHLKPITGLATVAS